MFPVAGLTWREAAQYTNWLHNGKQSGFDSLITGAYDSTTWGDPGPDGYPDEEHHLPGAKFWIPTLDEWLKAAYYDPDRRGDGEGGWWLHPNGTDTPLISGLPGEGGETSGGVDLPGVGEWEIPLGAYSDVTSPWGLLDVSGGASEFTEEFGLGNIGRTYGGSFAGWEFWWFLDQNWTIGESRPDSPSVASGLRIASRVPGPGSLSFVVVVLLMKRRKVHQRRRPE